MQIIYDGSKVQVWEFVSQGPNIGKWSTGKHCDGVAVVKNVKTIMRQEGGTLPLKKKLQTMTNCLGKCLPSFTLIRPFVFLAIANIRDEGG